MSHHTHHHDSESCCSHGSAPNLYAQTLDELDFEKSIHYACLNNDISRVKTIISKKGGSVVNEIDSTGYAPLHYAARKGYLDICHVLIDYGAEVNVITPELLSTPLHRASTYNHSKVVSLLLSFGAKPKLQDSDGKTCLHRACENGSKDVILILKNLIDFESLLKIKDKNEKIASECCKDGEILKLFDN
ncbi:ankyrin repeat domain-containing protein 39-like protein [Glomus cerebriforme]|uniref:Ankyrin repeat domain-containing protein 39-like protein n=1 Tax=Glomus cerebriforme TaxID=658196 RepID=A0A397SYF0_9GLOM|nr:ankyrin repeat domain-containing protein 39-like protein [Glomus cerebriforme]